MAISRHGIVWLTAGLLLTGCSQSRYEETRSAPGPDYSSPARDWESGEQTLSDGTGSRPSGVLGYTSPSSPGMRSELTMDEVREHVRNSTAVFIDARGTEDFARGHVRGALNMPPSRKEAYLDEIRKTVMPEQLVIVYCNSAHCDSSEMVAEYLASQGYTNVRVFRPGWKALSQEPDVK